MALGLKLKMSYENMQKGLIDGIHNGMEAVLVLTTVGALIGTWIAGGSSLALSTMVYQS